MSVLLPDRATVAPPTPADVTVVVLTHEGRQHLEACLAALAEMCGLPGLESVLVVDNASSDGTMSWLASRYPTVRAVSFPHNLGFAEGNDRAVVEHVHSPWVLLLNNDTAAAPDALRELCAALGEGGVCAGARLVDWQGRRLDFDGGGLSWTGHGHALGHGARLPRAPATTHPTVFTTGAAMLVHRATFLALGGFDPSYFAYYEDVDFGWRLLLAGYEPLHVPSAVVRHRGGGSARALPDTRRMRLHEGNALRSVAKNYDDATLAAALPAALALAAVRAGAPQGVIDEAPPQREAWPPLPAPEWSGWPALEPLALDWPAIFAVRATVQDLRRRSDEELVARFGRTWAPVPPTSAGWAALRRAQARFDLARFFGPCPEPSLAERVLGRLARVGRITGAAGVGGALRGGGSLRRGGKS